jgi:glycosyltransferase involved in cell wall biosynthesis/SAM-dependent methyltransferase/uncharacterized coiled-coil protein SlyX
MQKALNKELPWTGERYVPQIGGTIALEHLHRYAFASEYVGGKVVLDIASGEGYGSEMLCRAARHVYGVDIDEVSVTHARRKYRAKNLEYRLGSCTEIPLSDNSVDVVVSFETIEHITDHESMMLEVKRVLRSGGTLLISSPEKSVYDDINQKPNPFHLKELSQTDFRELLGRHFKHTAFLGQRALHGSALVGVDGKVAVARTYDFSSLPKKIDSQRGLSNPVYIVAICSDKPLKDPSGSLCEQNVWENEYCVEMIKKVADQEATIGQRDGQVAERDQWLLDAKSAIDERDGRLIQLGQEIEQKISQNNQLREVTTEREKQIINLESAVAQREETLRHLDKTLAERDKQIGALNDTIAIRDGRMSELVGNLESLSVRVTERDKQIGALTETISSKDAQLGELAGNLESLNASAAERDQQIGALNEALSTRDAQIGELMGNLESLSGKVTERDKQIGVLTEAISVKDGLFNKLAEKLQILNASVVERDKQIAGLHDVIANRDERIGMLNQDIAEKEKQISDLNQTLIGKEKIINEVTQLLSHSQESLSKLTSSLRWRITRPVGLLSDACDRMKKRLKKYSTAVRIYRTHRKTGIFDPVWYLENNPDVQLTGINPWRHFLQFGIWENRAPRSDFDAHAYLRLNPDVASSQLGAVEHYMTFGWKEERAIKEQLVQNNITAWVNHYRPQLVHLDKTKRTVLLVTHEISRTGAPILVLNLAEKLRKYYTVIVLSLGGGTLLEEFANACDLFIGPLMGEQSRHDFLCGFLKGVRELHPIDCAVVNCIVSTPILRPLWENDIPASHLIHEFSSYTRPETTFNESGFFSAKQIFSSKLVLENALSDYPNLANKSPLIMPQGRCLPPLKSQGSDDGMVERTRIDSILRPPGSPENLFVVIGLGTVQLRKGVDLFLECAHKVSKLKNKVPIRFVWFGHGYNVKLDGDYSVYLHDQMKRSGIEQMCAITHETDQLDYVYETADLLFLSSRLDPLPLVSQDMMAHGKPVLCFEKATGLAEFLMDDPAVRNCVIDYMDVEGAASRIVELANDHAEYRRVGKAFEAVLGKTFNLDRYAEQIHKHCEELIALEESEKNDREIIKESGLLDERFFQHHAAIDQLGIKAYMSLWASGLDHRKPFPGFHPGIYAEQNQIIIGDPFADYIRQGKPAGPWIQEVITPVEVTDEDLKKVLVPTALHLHLYYTEMVDDILSRIVRCKSRPDLLISVGDQDAEHEVEKALLEYGLTAKRIAVVPNRGRDIGPFLTEFGREITDHYEIIGHLHSKKTVTIEDQVLVRTWVDFLYGNLLGNDELMMDIILKRMGEDPSIGLVFPDDPYVMGWGENKKNAENLLGKMNVSGMKLYENINFPVGTMFWARTKALQPLFDLKLKWSDYPEEPLPYDGSMLHAIERSLPIIIKKNSFEELLISHPSQMR